MPKIIDALNTDADTLRMHHQAAFDSLLQQTAETDKASVLEPGQAMMEQALPVIKRTSHSNDARHFFSEGMKQMEIVDYPDHVRDIMQQYNDLWGEESALH